MEDFQESDISSEEDKTESDSESHSMLMDKVDKNNKHKLNSKNSQGSVKKFKLQNGKANIKQNKNDLYKPPTAEELNHLQETENLHHSLLFRLQVEEQLKEITIKNRYKSAFNFWYRSFEKCIQNLPEHEEIKLSTLARTKSKQKFINLLKEFATNTEIATDQDIVLKFIRPASLKIFGLYKIDSVVGPKLSVNINIVMPKSCVFEKDYLNNRYFIKKKYYLLYIYLKLDRELCANVSYNFKDGTLQIVPNINEKINVQVYVTPPVDTFKLMRCEPSVNNVRAHIFDSMKDVDLKELTKHGTVFYNSALAYDVTLNSNSDFMEKHLTEHKNIHDGIKLLSLWLKQRDLPTAVGGFTQDLLVYTILYLVLQRKINNHMSTYHVIRSVWVFLSVSNWHEQPITISENVSQEKLNEYRNYFDVVFLDKTGYYNLASFLKLDVYMKVKSEAELALKFLDNSQFDSFKALFLTKMRAELQYDSLISLYDGNNFKNVYKNIDISDKCKYMGHFPCLIIDKIISILKTGLNKRFIHIVPILKKFEDSSRESTSQSLTWIVFGITLNPSEAFKVVEKGPVANTAEAVTFRKFWGNLSECRRFTDGTVCEAVYFQSDTVQKKRQIFKKIIQHIVTEKLYIEQFQIISDEFEELLVLKNYIAPFPSGTAEEASFKIITVFDELSRKLRDFRLPLEIVAVQSISPIFSYTALFPPIPTNHAYGGKITSCKENNIILKETKLGMVPRYVEPVNCVLQLSMNSKWPQSLEALRQIKTGFYLEISKLLQESNILCDVKPEFLEVFYKGLVFRYEIYHPKEVSLLKRFTKADGVVGYKDNEESLNMEKRLNILPKIVGALNGIQSQNPSFGPSTALIKRWLRSQMIDEYYISDIIIDLLNASLFINGAPYKNAGLPQVAFFRFLQYIAEFDYNLQSVIVNFNDELKRESLDNLRIDINNRNNFPPLHIITPYDGGKSLFSTKCTKEILNRFSLLSKTALEIIQNSIFCHQDIVGIKELFVPNLKGYNALIHLKPFLNSKRYQHFSSNKEKVMLREYNENENKKIPVVDFNPVEIYLKELREHYKDLALFFYDPYGGTVIGVLWQPKALEIKDFKVSYIPGRKIDNNLLVLNVNAIIHDFYVLGKGLVKSIENRNK